MANVQMVHSKRIGARTAPITYTEDLEGYYIWTKTGRTSLKDGVEQCYFRCSGCQTIKDGGQAQRALISSVKINLSAMEWIGDVAQYQHICEPKNVNEVTGKIRAEAFRQPPRRQRTDYTEITSSILEAKDRLLEFLQSDDGLEKGERYVRKLERYLSRVGHLIGINAQEFRVMLQDEDENEGNAQAAAAGPMNQQVPEEDVQGVQEPLPDIVFDEERNVFRRA